jgi:hypothetical protein
MIGTHTYGQLDELEIIDGCAVMPIFKVMDTRSFVSRIRRRLRLT